MGIISGSGSFRGLDDFVVDLGIISGLWIISGSGSFRGLYSCILTSGDSNMKRQGVFLVPSGRYASSSQGYPPALNS